MNNSIIDIKYLINCKNKASLNWEKYNFVYRKFSKILIKKLKELNENFRNILVLSSDKGEVIENICEVNFENLIFLSPFRDLLEKIKVKEQKIQKIESSFKNLPCKPNKFDLIISNLYLHSIEKKKEHLTDLYNLLNDDGLLICNFFGEKTLVELKNAFYETDENIFNGILMRFGPSLIMVDISNLISEIGFKELVSEKINYNIYYDDVRKALRELKGIGERSNLNNKNKFAISRDYLKNLNNFYQKKFCDSNGLRFTCDIISITCWKNKKI